DAQQFGDIVLRAQPDASLLRIRDIGTVQLGAFTYSGFSRLKGQPSCNLIVFLSPGANAVDTSNQVRAFMQQAKANFPAGIDYTIPYDSTRFVRASISDVIFTLLAAIGLVIFVVFVFLQSWRATLIPLLTVPVAVIGAIALFPVLGFSINITSMFGLVLSIGIVVDDAIVVVEAVQRNIDDGMSPREATVRAMEQVSAPVVAIAFILAAVFIPVAFLGGISGQIYRQFSLTIASSVLLSAFSALSLSPALCTLLLKSHTKSRGPLAFAFAKFNSGFEWATNRYLSGVALLIRRSALALVALAVFWVAGAWLFKILPSGFLPDEDQSAFFVPVRLPDGASIDRTSAAVAKLEQRLLKVKGVDTWFVIGGTDFTTQTNASNVATIVVITTPWDQRKSKDLQLSSILAATQRAFSDVPEAFTTVFGFPPILGLSNTGGFQYMLEDRRGGELDQLSSVGDALVDAARKRREIGNVVNTFRASVPSYSIDMNLDKLQTLGVPVADAYNTLQTFLGGLYVNDFNRFSHTWQVLIQAEPEFRNQPSDIDRFYIRSLDGNMVPLGTLAAIKPSTGPEVVFRYNRFRAIQILGSPAPGVSSGQAIDAMEKVSAQTLPPGYGYEWTGTTYQQKLAQGHEAVIFGFASVLVFLCLAALYESWSIPLAVLLSVPLGLFGALLAVFWRNFPYDVYTQIGIVTLIGLAAKNAILIVEFAKDSRQQERMSVREAALHAAKLRLRPILMTSFAFILGVVPLFVATGAGAASRRSLGTAVFGGMLAATLLAIFFVPVQYYVVESLVERRSKRRRFQKQIEPEPVEATD
ncbi:MAG: efflux RND transporter permease subunit, partial [Bryobacterales bacterium]|nr:efflux RND transporter permease subunit [Bryobacterales bacterium]